jgi:hypothetical protein
MSYRTRTVPMTKDAAEDVRQKIGALPVQLVLDEWGTTLNHDEDILAYSAIIAQAANENLRAWVGIARKKGATWEQIGDALGMSRQAAHQRYGDRHLPLSPQAARTTK